MSTPRFHRLFHQFGIVILLMSLLTPLVDLEPIVAEEATPPPEAEVIDQSQGLGDDGVELTSDPGTEVLDQDGDDKPDDVDNCPEAFNPDQSDIDADRIGDVCDPDIDGDNLLTIEEESLGTDPYHADTDGDGIPDGGEVANGSNPLDATSPPPPVVELRPVDPTETIASCVEGTLSPAQLTFAITDGVTYRTEPVAPFSEGQTIQIIAKLDNAETTTWPDVLPQYWQLNVETGETYRAFTFTEVPCEPVENDVQNPPAEIGVDDDIAETLPSTPTAQEPEINDHADASTPAAESDQLQSEDTSTPQANLDETAASTPSRVAGNNTIGTPDANDQSSETAQGAATPTSTDSKLVGTPVASPQAMGMSLMSMEAQSEPNDCEVDFLGTVTCSGGNSDVANYLSVTAFHEPVIYPEEHFDIRYHISSSANVLDTYFKVRIQLPVVDAHAGFQITGDGNLQCNKVVTFGAERAIGVRLDCAGALPAGGETDITVELFVFTEDAWVITQCGLIGGTNPNSGFLQASGIWVYPPGESFPPSEGIYEAATMWLVCENQPLVELNIDRYPSSNGPEIHEGETMGFELIASSTGTADAERVYITVSLPTPPGTNWTSSSENCFIVGSVAVCDGISLDVGEHIRIQFTSPTTPESCGFHRFNARLLLPKVGEVSDLINYSAYQRVACDGAYFSITPSNRSPAPGEPIDFDLAIFNGSEVPALDNLKLSADIEAPEGTTWSVVESDTLAGCDIGNYSSSTEWYFHCDTYYPEIPALSAATVTIRAVPDIYECGQIEINGQASHRSGATIPDASTTVEVACEERPDIVSSYVAADPVIVVGEEISFTYTFTNNSLELRNWGVDGPKLPGSEWNLTSTGPFHRSQMPYICYTTAEDFKCSTEIANEFGWGRTGTITVSRTATIEDCGQTYGGSVEFTSISGYKGSWESNYASVQILCDPIATSLSGPMTITSGDPLSYTLSITNRMESTAVDVSVEDQLPSAGSLWTTSRPDDCSFESSTDTISCDGISLAGGETLQLKISLPSTGTMSCGGFTNTAWVNGVQSNTVLTSVLCDDSSFIFSRGVAEPVIAPGDTAVFMYRLIMPEDATGGNVTLQGDVLQGRSVDDWTITIVGDITGNESGDCTVDNQYNPYANVVCDLNMEPGDAGTITISRPVTTEDCFTEIGDGAEASHDGEIIRRTATVKIGCTDVDSSLTGPGSGRMNDELNYELKFYNYGNIDATITTATVQFPIWGFPSLENDNENCSVNTSTNLVTCENLTVPEFEVLPKPIPIPIKFTVANATGYCGDRATLQVHYTDSEGNTGSSPGFPIEFDCSPELNIDLEVQESSDGTNDYVNHKITVSNLSQYDASDVIVSDKLPDLGSVAVIDPTTGCTVSVLNLVECEISIPAHDGFSPGRTEIELQYTLPSDFSLCGNFTNVAYYQVETGGTKYFSNSEVTGVDCDLDLMLSLTGQGEVEPGGEAWGKLEIYNIGDERTNVSIKHELPADLVFLHEELPEGCTVTDNMLTCSGLTIPTTTLDTAPVTLKYDYSIPNDYTCGSEITRSAYLTWSTFTIQSDAITTDVVCSPNLSIEKTGDTEAKRGDTVSYAIKVSNSGTGPATDVTVTDDLPDTGSASTATEGCIVGTGNVVTCADLTIPATTGEANIEITYTLPADFESCSDITNTASFRLDINELVSSDPVNTEVTCGTNVKIQTSAALAEIDVGDDLEFDILLTNSGDISAKNVTFTTSLPTGAGLDWTIDPSTALDACEITGDTLTCTDLTLSALGDGPNQTLVTVASPTGFTPEEAACADGYTAKSVLSGEYGGESSATTELSNCDRAVIPSITVDLAECVDWSVTDSNITIGKDGAGVSVLVDPTGPQDGTMAQTFLVTLILEQGSAWPIEMTGWAFDGRIATRTYETDAVTCPPRPVSVDLSITSSDPTTTSDMPEGSTWRITSVSDDSVDLSGTFTADQLQLPATISLPEQLLPGDYLVEIDATPAFDLFSDEFTVPTETATTIGVLGLVSGPMSQGTTAFAAQSAPEPLSWDILLQVADPDDGDGGTTPDPDDGDGGTTPDPDDGDSGTTPDPDDGDGGTSTDPDDVDGGTTPDPDDGDGGTTTDPDDGDGGTTTDPDDGDSDDTDADGGSSTSEDSDSFAPDGSHTSTDTQASAGTDLVTGLPSTGIEDGDRMIDVTLIAMAISAIVLLATAVTVRRR